MTGGRVIVLGPTGRNFAAGMSGGEAYVLDETGDFATRCNQQGLSLEKLSDQAEIDEIRQMIQRHADYTHSQHAKNVLEKWNDYVPKFVKVMPNDYKRMQECIKRAKSNGLSGEDALMAAFEENARDLARVGGS
jgi:glutamate synthase (ferredoxin)